MISLREYRSASGPTNGIFRVEFLTQAGKHYYIQYADTLSSLATNAQTVSPVIVGTGGSVQWIDDGPPKTISIPMSVSSRVYRVIRSP